jgi:hypothetical protein
MLEELFHECGVSLSHGGEQPDCDDRLGATPEAMRRSEPGMARADTNHLLRFILNSFSPCIWRRVIAGGAKPMDIDKPDSLTHILPHPAP